MQRYDNCSDEFYVNLNLNTEMELNSSRETVLHYFELIQKQYPSMRNFYSRDRADHVLEEEKERGHYRWVSVEKKRLCSGCVNPESVEATVEQNAFVLDIAPHALSVSPLDCESLNLMFGFDFNYRGNHNQLVAEVLGLPPAFEGILNATASNAVSYDPSIQFAVSDDCRLQCRLSIETRTSAYHIRTGEFPDEQISVYVTARRFGGLDAGESYVDALHGLTESCIEVVDNYALEQVLLPLQQTIAMK